ncbi:chromosome segregation protein SMC [Thioclava sp. GXIMD4216]|uniref:AAA family ATPase n=1 Tax=Thioclava sp. GXIMD4216 TaxID=3131929 RepID=UPI0030D26C07
MKLRAIRLDNVRRFTDPVELCGIGDGLNVLSEPNEHGKSTLFDALRALFFERHSSKNKAVSSLRPYSGGAPEVQAEIETEQGRFTLAKRWFAKPMAEVRQNGRVIAQSDAAEDWIARVLGTSEGGPAGLIWVRQGMTELEGPVKAENEAALEARRDLMSSVTEEVEAMTGGRRMDMALARVKAELEQYVTPNRRPRKNGPLQEVIDRIAGLERDETEQQARVHALHRDLETRKRHRKSLADLEDPEEHQARQARLAHAGETRAKALRHAEQMTNAEQVVAADELALSRAGERLKQVQRAKTELNAARTAIGGVTPRLAAAQTAEGAALAHAATLQEALQTARQSEQQQADLHRRASLAEAARQGAARKAELALRITQAEAARKNHEEARAEASLCLTPEQLDTLETLARAVATERRLREAGAVQIAFHASGAQEVRLDGVALGPVPAALWAQTELTLPGLGVLHIDPGARHDSGAVALAEDRLAQALARVAMPDLAQARASAQRHREAAARARDAQAELAILAPKGIEALRRDHAQIPAPLDMPDLPPPAQTQTTLEAAQAEVARLGPLAAQAQDMALEARLEAGGLKQALEAATDRLTRARMACDEIAQLGEEDDLAADLARGRDRLQASRALLEELARKAPDLAAAEAAFSRAQSVMDAARSETIALQTELARLDERILAANGQAIEETLRDTQEALEAARATQTRLDHEVAVLIRLEDALTHARNAAREQYFTPIATALRPLLGLLWPEADLQWTSEKLLPEALIRDGQAEPVEILSGGTQEQIALMVRLAFARLLQDAGRIAPIILDDALVYTDDDRIEKMFDALNRQAGDLQILVLTCRQRAFRDLGGQRLRLTAPTPDRSLP